MNRSPNERLTPLAPSESSQIRWECLTNSVTPSPRRFERWGGRECGDRRTWTRATDVHAGDWHDHLDSVLLRL
jgi:hypothetical protein